MAKEKQDTMTEALVQVAEIQNYINNMASKGR